MIVYIPIWFLRLLMTLGSLVLAAIAVVLIAEIRYWAIEIFWRRHWRGTQLWHDFIAYRMAKARAEEGKSE